MPPTDNTRILTDAECQDDAAIQTLLRKAGHAAAGAILHRIAGQSGRSGRGQITAAMAEQLLGHFSFGGWCRRAEDF